MVTMRTVQEIRKSFIQWNGWGPPTSEYQISEYCRSETLNEEDSEHEFWVLMEWMNEKR